MGCRAEIVDGQLGRPVRHARKPLNTFVIWRVSKINGMTFWEHNSSSLSDIYRFVKENIRTIVYMGL